MGWIRFSHAVLGAAIVLAPATAEAKWLKAETKNFVIFSAGTDKELRRFAVNLERFHATAQRVYRVEARDNPNRLTVYFLDSQESVSRLAGNKRGSLAGFYSPRLEGSFAVSNRNKADDKFDLDGTTVLFHEYSHHFMARNFSYAYPAWYVEGFAEYISTVTFDDKGGWTLGKPAYHRAYSLLEAERIPVEKLLLGKVSDLKPGELGPFYGRAWLLVHMLNMDPAYKGKLAAYFSAVGQGKPHREAAETAFGNLAELDKALNVYLGKRLRYLGTDQPIPAATEVTVSPLGTAAEQVLEFRLARLLGPLDAKEMAELQALARSYPAEAGVWYELARAQRAVALAAGQDEARKAGLLAAEQSVDKALAADPAHVHANVLKANLALERLRDQGDDNPAHWTAARDYLITANAHAHDDPLVLTEWYDSFVTQGRAPSKNARDGLARAFELAPEVIEVRVKYAFDLATQGRFDEALGLVDYLAQHPHHAAQGQELVGRLKQIRERAAQREAARATAPAPAPAPAKSAPKQDR